MVDLAEERATRTAAEIEAAGGAALAIACDVRDETSVQRMIEQTVQRFGRVDVLVNAAGGYTLGRVSHQLSAEDWDLVLDSNLKGSFLCCKHVIPHMLKAGGGRIVNFSSNAGRTSSPALGVHYTAAKAGVLGLTRHLAKEHASHRILVNTIAPGPALGERNYEIMGEEAREAPPPGHPARAIRRAIGHLGGGPLPGVRGRAPHHGGDARRQRRLRDGVSRSADEILR